MVPLKFLNFEKEHHDRERRPVQNSAHGFLREPSPLLALTELGGFRQGLRHFGNEKVLKTML